MINVLHLSALFLVVLNPVATPNFKISLICGAFTILVLGLITKIGKITFFTKIKLEN